MADQKLTDRGSLSTSKDSSYVHVVQDGASLKQTKLNFLKEDRGRIEDLELTKFSNTTRIDNLEINQFTGVEVYSELADLPTTGTALVSYKVSNDPTSSNNGYYHWETSAYVKDADLVANEIDVDNNSDSVSGYAVARYKSLFRKDATLSVTGSSADEVLTAFKSVYIDGADDALVYFIQFLRKTTTIGINVARLNGGYEIVSSASFTDIPTGINTFTIPEFSGSGIFCEMVINFDELSTMEWGGNNGLELPFSEYVKTQSAYNDVLSFESPLALSFNLKNNSDTFLKAIKAGSATITVIGTSITFGSDLYTRKNIWANQLLFQLEKQYPNVDFTINNLGIPSRRLEDYVNASFVALASDPVDKRTGFSVTSTLDNWQSGVVLGNSWMEHAENTAPDLFIIHHGANDAGYDPVIFRGWLNDAYDNMLTWSKIPSFAICTEILGSLDPLNSFGDYLPNNVFIERYARLCRNFAIEKNASLIDFNRYWRLLRDGDDETQIEFYKETPSTFTLTQGSALDVQTDTSLVSTNTAVDVVSTVGELYVEANFTGTINLTNATSEFVFGVGSKDNETNYFKQFAVRLRAAKVQVWQGQSNLSKETSLALTTAVDYQLDIYLSVNYVKIYIDKVKVLDYKTPSLLSRANVSVGVLNATVTNMVIEAGVTRKVQDAIYPEITEQTNPLLGGYTTTLGGNGYNHPSRVGIMEVFVPSIKDFINKIN